MAITKLSQASALNPGADLWVIPNTQHSKLSHRIDWYLNFQFLKNELYSPKTTAAILTNILNECEIEPPNSKRKKNDGLLIGSEKLLPNRWVVQFPYTNNLENWCKKIIHTWEGLGKPTLRIFLPTGLSAGEFQSIWDQTQSFNDFTVVVD